MARAGTRSERAGAQGAFRQQLKAKKTASCINLDFIDYSETTSNGLPCIHFSAFPGPYNAGSQKLTLWESDFQLSGKPEKHLQGNTGYPYSWRTGKNTLQTRPP
jgi:hypothetical protein